MNLINKKEGERTVLRRNIIQFLWIFVLLTGVLVTPVNQASATIGSQGIAAEQWMWKESTASTWNAGKPTTFDANKIYLVYLRVQDVEGAWSDPYVRVVSTGANLPPIADFRISPQLLPLGQTATYTDYSYDPNPDDTIEEHQWRYREEGGSWSSVQSTEPNYTQTFNQPNKTYEVELKVMDNHDAWSEPVYQKVKVIPENEPPIAWFDMSPKPNAPKDVTITYWDDCGTQGNCYDPEGDPIVAKEWKYRFNGGAWQSGNPLDDPNSLMLGTYEIALQVLDQPSMPQLQPKWSAWYSDTINIIPPNEKPTAVLVLDPNPVVADEPLTWIDKSIDPEMKNLVEYVLTVKHIQSSMIKQFNSTYNKASGASLDLSSSFIQYFETSGFPDDGIGEYEITYRVKDESPNGFSPSLWSDPQVQTLIVEDPLRIVGEVTPDTARSGQVITLQADTEGRAQTVKVEVDWNQDGDFDDENETIYLDNKFPVSDKNNEWTKDIIIPLQTKDGTYTVTFTATKMSVLGLRIATDDKIVTVQGDVFDDYLMEYYE